MKHVWVGVVVGFVGGFALLFFATVLPNQKLFNLFKLFAGTAFVLSLYLFFIKKPHHLVVGILVGVLLSYLGVAVLLGTP
jgi:hypothetical protein